jgi:hypothetical protein
MREPRFRGIGNCSYFYRPLGYSDRCPSGENNLGLRSIFFILWCSFLWWAMAFSLAKLHNRHHTPYSLGLLWTSDQPRGETSSWQQKTLFRRQISVLAGGIRTHSLGKRAAADSHLIRRGAKQFYIYCKWQCIYICSYEPPNSKPKILL